MSFRQSATGPHGNRAENKFILLPIACRTNTLSCQGWWIVFGDHDEVAAAFRLAHHSQIWPLKRNVPPAGRDAREFVCNCRSQLGKPGLVRLGEISER
jgi:hypothetical protein